MTRALAIVRDVLLVAVLLGVIGAVSLFAYGAARGPIPTPAPSSYSPPVPLDRCGGGMC